VPKRRRTLVKLPVRIAVAAAPAAVVLATACSHKESSLAIRVDGPTTTILGPFDTIRHPTLAGAIQTFGPPSKCEHSHPPGTDLAAWEPFGLRLEFDAPANSTPCGLPGKQALSGEALVSGPRWRTEAGLAIGDSVARLGELYPQARLRRYDGPTVLVTGWWLVTRAYRDPDLHPFPGLVARTERGRVTGFVVPIPGLTRDAPIGRPVAPKANDSERAAIRRSGSLPRDIRNAPVECLSISLRMSLDRRYALGGVALRLGPRCHGYLYNGYDIFHRSRSTGAWTIVYEGSDWPPCSLRIPLELHSCVVLDYRTGRRLS
jgi:hypothetical protein